MKLSWLIHKKHKHLLLIFNGWGFDEHAWVDLHAPAQTDVLLISDYTTLDNADTLQYTEDYVAVSVLAWSFGVYAAQLCSRHIHHARHCVAVNGTLHPVHDTFGIPAAVFNATLSGYNDTSRDKFMQRVAGSAAALQARIQALPRRSTASQLAELQALAGYFHQPPPAQGLHWRQAIVARRDRIFPPANMHAAWQRQGVVVSGIDSGHWPDFNAIVRQLP